jgi:hypothetical protein
MKQQLKGAFQPPTVESISRFNSHCSQPYYFRRALSFALHGHQLEAVETYQRVNRVYKIQRFEHVKKNFSKVTPTMRGSQLKFIKFLKNNKQ